MSNRQFTVRTSYGLGEEIDKIVKAKGKDYTTQQFFIEAAERYVNEINQIEMDSFYAPRINAVMQSHLKQFDNRIAGLLAKVGLDSGMSMLMLLELLTKDSPRTSKEIYDLYRQMAAKHVKQREHILDEHKNAEQPK